MPTYHLVNFNTFGLFNSPSKIVTAGPVIYTWLSPPSSIFKFPPKSSTLTLFLVNPFKLHATALAQAPVPHANVSPVPLS
mgnify:CR=1 FL=1